MKGFAVNNVRQKKSAIDDKKNIILILLSFFIRNIGRAKTKMPQNRISFATQHQ